MGQLKARGPQNDIEALRIEIFDKVNALGIGAQGLGGLATDPRRQDHGLAVPRRGQAGGDDPQLRRDAPRAFHARRLGPELSSSRPSSTTGPRSTGRPTQAAIRVDLDTLTPEVVQSWKHGDRLLLNGKMLTGRDAAHKRIAGHAGQGRGAAGRVQGPRDLLCRPGRSGRAARSSARPARPPRRGWTSSPT